jgi:hypothetical protein
VSRSVHTTPIHLRAARRARAPLASRGAAERRRADRLRRSLREAGAAPRDAGCPPPPESSIKLPRIHASRLCSGLIHAITEADIRRTLLCLGEVAFYGLREVHLLPGAAARPPGLHLGRYMFPGTVRIFAVEPSPWNLIGRPDPASLERMRLYGAVIEDHAGVAGTVIRWPGTSLRDFVLIDVLMHEVGHHIIQQYTGKRPARVRRTSDHERFATTFAERCRVRYLHDRPLG